MQRLSAWSALAALALGAQASALDLTLRHSDGEFVDRGTVSAEVASTTALRLDCAAGVAVARNGNDLQLTVTPASGMGSTGGCTTVAVDLGRFAAGTYRVRALVVAGAATEDAARTLVVLPLEGRCNAEPALQPALMVAPVTSASAFAQRVAADPAYAASLGHPVVRTGLTPGDQLAYLTYPPLVDPTVMSVRLHETGDFTAVYRNGYACFSAPPPDRIDTFLEFHHAGLDQYFHTADAAEIAAIDRGDVGPWMRTGERFAAVTARGCEFSSSDTVVYRFAGKPGVGSHFFTRDRAECSIVDRAGPWEFEGIPFYAAAPQSDGTCGTGHTPLYRVWRAFGVSNHRFTTDPAIVAAMTARGWIAEGVAMCVRSAV